MMPKPMLAILCVVGMLVSARPAFVAADDRVPMNIVCTVGMVADVVRQVAGDRAEVSALMGPGIDPHLYRPTRGDIVRMARADAVFAVGLHLEGKMIDALERAHAGGRPVHFVGDAVRDAGFLGGVFDPEHPDPHVWMDPVIWKQTAPVVAEALAELDPAGEDLFRANAGRYMKELDDLHEYAQRVLASVPESQRVLVTAHDAFGYFGRRYGFEVVGIQGISTESEAGVRDIERIVDLLVTRRIPAVFVESTVSDRYVRALVAGAAARGASVVLGARLFSDAMGAGGTYEGTYLGMIDHNITAIARSLGGEAPERGMRGELSAQGASP